MNRSPFSESTRVDLCVVGGGLAGLCAAVSAARRGLSVALMHERPVLGGNASSEVRMWVCGARGPNNRETGLVEEIMLDNRYRNAGRNWSLWDSILYEKASRQPNLKLLLNCTCVETEMAGSRIRAVRGWQMTTQTWQRVEADLFTDCSGDSILAPLTGAEVRVGREARSEFGESIAPEHADRRTMGLSCLIQARETARPQPFVPPSWAYTFKTDADLPHRTHEIHQPANNFWWIEIGGEDDSIRDSETIRDELLRIALGVWDHIKNQADHGAENWELEWLGFLPGRRESRRYVGDHILTQGDVRSEGRFPDLVAYGGWPMDDHHPAGLRYSGEPTIFHAAPSPFGIPYRCLYSRNVDNLLCAGRNISVTHTAMSSTRVMATCGVIGQAVGTAASLAAGLGASPRRVYREAVSQLQQALLDDDCYLPGVRRAIPEPARSAMLRSSGGDPEPLRNGVDRPVGAADNGWRGAPGGWIEYAFARPTALREARIVFDSDLCRTELPMPSSYPLNRAPVPVPAGMVRSFRLEAPADDGSWRTVHREPNNWQRLVRVPLQLEAAALRLVIEQTWGSPDVHLFAFEVR